MPAARNAGKSRFGVGSLTVIEPSHTCQGSVTERRYSGNVAFCICRWQHVGKSWSFLVYLAGQLASGRGKMGLFRKFLGFGDCASDERSTTAGAEPPFCAPDAVAKCWGLSHLRIVRETVTNDYHETTFGPCMRRRGFGSLASCRRPAT
jgi:hypothetical protein